MSRGKAVFHNTYNIVLLPFVSKGESHRILFPETGYIFAGYISGTSQRAKQAILAVASSCELEQIPLLRVEATIEYIPKEYRCLNGKPRYSYLKRIRIWKTLKLRYISPKQLKEMLMSRKLGIDYEVTVYNAFYSNMFRRGIWLLSNKKLVYITLDNISKYCRVKAKKIIMNEDRAILIT